MWSRTTTAAGDLALKEDGFGDIRPADARFWMRRIRSRPRHAVLRRQRTSRRIDNLVRDVRTP
jgi:hypothetical protein